MENDIQEEEVLETDVEAPKNTQVVVIPDDAFCKENNLTPSSKAVWVDHPLPKGWKPSNNILTGRSLPEADIAALLAAVHGASKTGENTLHEASASSLDKTVPTPAPGGQSPSGLEQRLDSARGLDTNKSLALSAAQAESPGRLEQGLDSPRGSDADKNVPPSATGAQSPGELEQGQGSARGLDANKRLSPPAPGAESPGELVRGQGSAGGPDANKRLPPPYLGAESPGGLEQGQGSPRGLDANKRLPPPAPGADSPGELEKGQGFARRSDAVMRAPSPAPGGEPTAWLEDELASAIRLDAWSPTHDTTGNVMRFLSEMRKQSNRLSTMEKREEHLEKMIECQGLMIVQLQESVQEVIINLKSQTTTKSAAPLPPLQVAVTEGQVLAGGPSGGARARVQPRLPRAPQPASGPQDQPEPPISIPARRQEASSFVSNQTGLLRATLKCNSCGPVVDVDDASDSLSSQGGHDWSVQPCVHVCGVPQS